jgi:ferric-dicitrate binding protein FerR (iron transport regulator)
MTRNYRPAATRASDADRDAVVSDLSEHFQAGRLTAAELDERTGRALTARTWGELGELAADLPALRPAPAATPAAGRPQPPARHTAPALTAALAGLAIAAVVLVHMVHGGWGLIWLLLPVLLIARRVICH